MPGIRKNSTNRIALHIGFWIVSLIFTLLLLYYNGNRIGIDFGIFTKALLTNTGFAFAVYINLIVLIPRFLKKKNYVFYVFWLVVLLSFTSLLLQFIFTLPLAGIFGIGLRVKPFDVNLHAAFFSTTLIYVALTSFLKFVKEWLTMQDLNLKLAKIEQQKLEAELKTLKGQLNPHFLFNSLNNIYSLSLIQSDKVPDLILRLAELMRHIIYESRENFIDVQKEIGFVTNFIALQKIRAQENADIQFTLTGDIPSAKIAPLIFEPFIDNAFKHGLPGTEGKDFIKISFHFDKNSWLEFQAKNNYEQAPAGTFRKTGGIGIENVKQRLKLLYSPKEYELDITHKNHIHGVKLRLKLK